MVVRRHLWLVIVLALVAVPRPDGAASSIAYRFTIPEPQHHWMQVEATFTGLGAAPLELRMSRSSTGRYALHDFAKNVYDVHAVDKDQDGRELFIARPDPSGWAIGRHGGTVTIKYKVYGDHVDGTYLAIDTTHLHMNMPAAIMWARGFDDAPATLAFAQPSGVAGRAWTVATQLHPGATSLEFTAPNLQYLMDSPVEFGPTVLRQFTVGSRAFRVAVHHTGANAELDRFVRDVERVVREEGAIYGESGVRTWHLYVSRRLPAVRGRRRHGTSEQHGDDFVGQHPQRPRGTARHGGTRILPLLECRADSPP